MLTQRQEIFCNQIILGKTAGDAAVIAGYSPKWAATHSTRWLKMANISNRLYELRMATQGVTVATVKERKEKLTEVIRKDLPDKVTAKERVMAIAEHNKMDGDYAPAKVEVTGKDGQPIAVTRVVYKETEVKEITNE